MGSLDSTSVPSTLPILSLKSPNLTRDLYAACRDHGFFYLIDHGIPPQTLKYILQLARRFFLESSVDEKDHIKRKPTNEGGDGARGYQVLNENVTKGLRDFHEAIDFYREFDNHNPAHTNASTTKKYEFLHGPNLWPIHPPELKHVYEQYIEQCTEVGTKMVKAMGEALGLDGDEHDNFVKATRKSFWVMRMIGYPPLQNSKEAGVSCGEHSDYGCVTLLLADDTKGALQVQHKDGSWLNADPIPGAFVVNIGDMMEKWTNGEWKSTNHRVIHRGSEYRISVPFFFEPDFDAMIKPLSKCVERTGGQVKYKPVVYGEHLSGKAESNFYGTDDQ